MKFPPVNDRALAMRQEERKRLQKTHDNCAVVFGPILSEAEAAALAWIIDALKAITVEIDAPTVASG